MTKPMNQNRQYGRTLVELLVSMAIGLVIVAGVSILYFSSSGLSRTSSQVSTVEQAGQLALLIIGDSLKLAAYGEIIGSDFVATGQTLMDDVHLRGCSNAWFTDPLPPYAYGPGGPTALPPVPDLTCGVVAGGDSLYIRHQSAPVRAEVEPADAARITMFDCGASSGNQLQMAGPGAGSGIVRPIVTNVFRFDQITGTLQCEGYGGGGVQPLLNNVVDFKVFYRFDDPWAAASPGTGSVTNILPFGNSIRDAAYINGLAIPDPWRHVVAVIVCITLKTDAGGVAVTSALPSRCPVNAAEAEAGINLVGAAPPADGSIHRTFSQVFTIRARATPTPSVL